MADKLTPEQRHKNMSACKNKDSGIELALRLELWHRGYRYRKNSKEVYGHPDIVFIGKKVAIFCDGDYWHGRDWENKKYEIKTRREFWWPKIERNMQRDKEVTERLQEDGWIVIRLWGSEIKKNLQECIDRVIEVLEGMD